MIASALRWLGINDVKAVVGGDDCAIRSSPFVGVQFVSGLKVNGAIRAGTDVARRKEEHATSTDHSDRFKKVLPTSILRIDHELIACDASYKVSYSIGGYIVWSRFYNGDPIHFAKFISDGFFAFYALYFNMSHRR